MRAAGHIAQRRAAERRHLTDMNHKARETIRQVWQHDRDRQDRASQAAAETGLSREGEEPSATHIRSLQELYMVYRTVAAKAADPA